VFFYWLQEPVRTPKKGVRLQAIGETEVSPILLKEQKLRPCDRTK